MGLDLASFPFGTQLQTNNGFVAVADPTQASLNSNSFTNIVWMTNAVSGKYHEEFAKRVLRYGFCGGRLVAIRISVNSWADANGHFELPAAHRAVRNELDQIEENFRKVNRKDHHLNDYDQKYQVHIGYVCSNAPGDIFVMEIQFTAKEPKTGG